MKTLIVSLVFLLLCTTHAWAATATESGTVAGDTDDTASAAAYVATPAATTKARATTYQDTRDTPVSGAVENTLFLGLGGITFLFLGYRYTFSKEA